MAQAERETRAFLVYEKQMKALEEAKSAASEKDSTTASSQKTSASKQDSSTKKIAQPKLKPANAMRSKGRANVSRMAPAKPVVKPKKKPKQAPIAAANEPAKPVEESKG